MATTTTINFGTLAKQIQSIDFDHPFILSADGSIVDAPGNVYAPEAFEVEGVAEPIEGEDWQWFTYGMSGQLGYYGPVMHPSEFIGARIAEEMHRWTEDGPQTYAVVEVIDLESEESSGWAIVRMKAEASA